MSKKMKSWDSIAQASQKDLKKLLELLGQDSIFLFDTETTSLKADDPNTQIWEIGGLYYSRISGKFEQVHYYVKPIRSKDMINPAENMYVHGVMVKTRDFFYDQTMNRKNLYNIMRENPGVKLITEKEIFSLIPALHGGRNNVLGAFNLQFDKKMLNTVAKRYGIRGIDESNILDFPALLLDILPAVRNDKIATLTDEQINRVPSGKMRQALRKAREEYKHSEVLKNKETGEEASLGDILKRAKYEGLDPNLASYITTGRFKLGEGRYNLEKMRVFFNTPGHLVRALIELKDSLGLNISRSEIDACVMDVNRIIIEYNLNQPEQHDALKDTIQMIGLGVIAVRLNELLKIYDRTPGGFANILNIIIGYENGQFNPRTATIVGSGKPGSSLSRPGMVSGVQVQKSGMYTPEEKALIEEYERTQSGSRTKQRSIEEEIKNLSPVEYQRVVDSFALSLTDNDINKIQDSKFKNDVRLRKQQLLNDAHKKSEVIHRVTGKRYSASGIDGGSNLTKIIDIDSEADLPKNPKVNDTYKIKSLIGSGARTPYLIFGSDNVWHPFFPGSMQESGVSSSDGRVSGYNDDAGFILDEKAARIDKFLQGLERAEGLSAEPGPNYEVDHVYVIKYTDSKTGRTVTLKSRLTYQGRPMRKDQIGKVKPDGYEVEVGGEWIPVYSTTTMGKTVLGTHKYSDYNARRHMKVLGHGAGDLETLSEQILGELNSEQSVTEKGTLVHKVIELVETEIRAHKGSALKLYNAIINYQVSKLPETLKKKLYSKNVFPNGLVMNWLGREELITWVALREELKIPDNQGIETETSIVAYAIDPMTGKRIIITGSVDGLHKNLLIDFKNTQWIDPNNPEWYFQLKVYKKILKLQFNRDITAEQIVALVPSHVDPIFKDYIYYVVRSGGDFTKLSFEDYKKRAILNPTAMEVTPVDFNGKFVDPKTGRTIDHLVRVGGKFVGNWVHQYFTAAAQKAKLDSYFKGDAERWIGDTKTYTAFKAKYPKITEAVFDALKDMYKYTLRSQQEALDVFKRAWNDPRPIFRDNNITLNGKQVIRIAVSNYISRVGIEGSSIPYTVEEVSTFFDVVGKHIGASDRLTDEGPMAWYMPETWEERKELEALETDENAKRRKEQLEIRLDSKLVRTIADEVQIKKEFSTATAHFFKVYSELQKLLLNKELLSKETGGQQLQVLLDNLDDQFNEIKHLIGEEPFLQELFYDFVDAIIAGNLKVWEKALATEDEELRKHNKSLFKDASVFAGYKQFIGDLVKIYGKQGFIVAKVKNKLDSILDLKVHDSVQETAHVLASEIVRAAVMDEAIDSFVGKNKRFTYDQVRKSLGAALGDDLNRSRHFAAAYDEFIREYNTLMRHAEEEGASVEDIANRIRFILKRLLTRLITASTSADYHTIGEKIASGLYEYDEEGNFVSTGTEFIDPNSVQKIFVKIREFLESADDDQLRELVNILVQQVSGGSKQVYQRSVFSTLSIVSGNENDDTNAIVIPVPALFFDKNLRSGNNRFTVEELIDKIIRRLGDANTSAIQRVILQNLQDIINELLAEENNKGNKHGRDIANRIMRALEDQGIIWGDPSHTTITYMEGAKSVAEAEKEIRAIQAHGSTSHGVPKEELERVLKNLQEANALATQDKVSIEKVLDFLTKLESIANGFMLSGKAGPLKRFIEEYRMFCKLNKISISFDIKARTVSLKSEEDGSSYAITYLKSQPGLWGDIFVGLHWSGASKEYLEHIQHLINDISYYKLGFELRESIKRLGDSLKAIGVPREELRNYESLLLAEEQLDWLKHIINYLSTHKDKFKGSDIDRIILNCKKLLDTFTEKFKKLSTPVIRGDTKSTREEEEGGTKETPTSYKDTLGTRAGRIEATTIEAQTIKVDKIEVTGDITKGTGAGGGPGVRVGHEDKPTTVDPRYTFADPSKVSRSESMKILGPGSGQATIVEKGLNSEGDMITKTSTYNTVLGEDGWKIGEIATGTSYKLDHAGADPEDLSEKEKKYRATIDELYKTEESLKKLEAKLNTQEAKNNEYIVQGIKEQIKALKEKRQLLLDQESDQADAFSAEDVARIKDDADRDHKIAEANATAAAAREKQAQQKIIDDEYKSLVAQETSVLQELQKLERQDALTSKYNIVTKRGIHESIDSATTRLNTIRAEIEAKRGGVSQATIDAVGADQQIKLDTSDRKLRMYNGGALNLWQGMQQAMYNTTRSLTGIGLAYKIIGQIQQSFRQVIQYAKDLDKVFVNLRIVTGYNAEETNSLMKSYSNLAKQLGATTSEVANSGNEWFNV